MLSDLLHGHPASANKLKEVLGHTPLQVSLMLYPVPGHLDTSQPAHTCLCPLHLPVISCILYIHASCSCSKLFRPSVCEKLGTALACLWPCCWYFEQQAILKEALAARTAR